MSATTADWDAGASEAACWDAGMSDEGTAPSKLERWAMVTDSQEGRTTQSRCQLTN